MSKINNERQIPKTKRSLTLSSPVDYWVGLSSWQWLGLHYFLSTKTPMNSTLCLCWSWAQYTSEIHKIMLTWEVSSYSWKKSNRIYISVSSLPRLQKSFASFDKLTKINSLNQRKVHDNFKLNKKSKKIFLPEAWR